MTPTIRSFLGSPCPRCRRDILQAAPSTNRMPGADLAYCPGCKHSFSVDDLSRTRRGPAGLLKRLFGGGSTNPQ